MCDSLTEEDELGRDLTTVEFLFILLLTLVMSAASLVIDVYERVTIWPFKHEQAITRVLVGGCILGIVVMFVDNFGRFAGWWGG